jgi:3-methyladenine DNA glycosylase/8-oxoguanine DNA glycosylase
VWPATDLAVQRTLRAHIDGRRSLERTSERFAPRRSSLARYLWRIADAPPA